VALARDRTRPRTTRSRDIMDQTFACRILLRPFKGDDAGGCPPPADGSDLHGLALKEPELDKDDASAGTLLSIPRFCGSNHRGSCSG
jgi:hypothetical protein